MPKVCFFKNCKSISDRHPDKVFVPFVKPYTDYKRCERWIQLSGRPSHPPHKITKDSYLCSDHFSLNEVLDWKKNPTLDPIPLHRLKKVDKEEVFRKIYRNSNAESEDNWVDETDWTDVENKEKPNLAEKVKKNYSKRKGAVIKKIRDSIPDVNLRKKLDDILSQNDE